MLKWIILAYFAKHLTNHALIFCAFGRKTQFIGNFEKIFENFSNDFLRKLLKIRYFSIFFKRFNKPCVNFLRVWPKTQSVGKFWENFENFWWKFYRKIEFFIFIFLENLLLKIEPSEITPFFFNNFFGFGGGGEFPPPFPLATPLNLMKFYL